MKPFQHLQFQSAIATLISCATLSLMVSVARADDSRDSEDRDPAILSFSTVGDSRQDPDAQLLLFDVII